MECHACGALRAGRGAWSLRRACAPAALRGVGGGAPPRPRAPATLPWHRGGRELSSLVSPSESSPWALPLVTPASWQPPGVARVSCPRLRFEVLVVLRHEAKPLQSSNKEVNAAMD